jgi:hypothetical protein
MMSMHKRIMALRMPLTHTDQDNTPLIPLFGKAGFAVRETRDQFAIPAKSIGQP